jgi:predicted Zn-dependent peptidase
VKRVEEVIKAIIVELNKIKAEKVSKEELNKAKDYLTGTMFLGLESSDAVAEFTVFKKLCAGNYGLRMM